MLQIVRYPHPALRYRSQPVDRIDGTLRSQVREMFDLMYASRGIGLAANQVALPFQFFILNLTADPAQKDQELVFINPQIVKRHGQVIEEEGCLSFPGLYVKVPRAKRIRVRAFDLDGKDVEVEAEDLLSRAIQHETDHVHGRLFIDLAATEQQSVAQSQCKQFESAFRAAQEKGEIHPDSELLRQLEAIVRGEFVAPSPLPVPDSAIHASA